MGTIAILKLLKYSLNTIWNRRIKGEPRQTTMPAIKTEEYCVNEIETKWSGACEKKNTIKIKDVWLRENE